MGVPRFSVIVPAYNASVTIAQTLDGVLAQRFSDWECVVVDDGSTDGTASITQTYVDRDSRFRLIRQANAGCAGAYRTGIQHAVADLLVICAADDFLLPEHMMVMDRLASSHPETDIFSCNGEYLFEQTGFRRLVYQTPEWSEERSLSFEQVVEACFFSVGAVLRRSVYDLTGGHRPGVYVDDYDLWLRAMARGARHWYTPEVLAVHRISDFQQTADLVRVYESNSAVLKNLINEGLVTGSRASAVEAAIAVNRDQVVEEMARLGLAKQGDGLRKSATKVLGRRGANVFMRAVHLLSWASRPARRVILRRRARRSSGV